MWTGSFAPIGLMWWGSALTETLLDMVCLVGSGLFVGSELIWAMSHVCMDAIVIYKHFRTFHPSLPLLLPGQSV